MTTEPVIVAAIRRNSRIDNNTGRWWQKLWQKKLESRKPI